MSHLCRLPAGCLPVLGFGLLVLGFGLLVLGLRLSLIACQPCFTLVPRLSVITHPHLYLSLSAVQVLISHEWCNLLLLLLLIIPKLQSPLKPWLGLRAVCFLGGKLEWHVVMLQSCHSIMILLQCFARALVSWHM